MPGLLKGQIAEPSRARSMGGEPYSTRASSRQPNRRGLEAFTNGGRIKRIGVWVGATNAVDITRVAFFIGQGIGGVASAAQTLEKGFTQQN